MEGMQEGREVLMLHPNPHANTNPALTVMEITGGKKRTGHVKLTDFGACRPLTKEAEEVVKEGRGAVRRLGAGGWNGSSSGGEGVGGGKGEEEKEEEDERIEGTVGYMPPEVIRDGSRPDKGADCWALGCLIYQCIIGRPPVLFFSLTSPRSVRRTDVRVSLGAPRNEKARALTGGRGVPPPPPPPTP